MEAPAKKIAQFEDYISVELELLKVVRDVLSYLDNPNARPSEWYKVSPEHVGRFRRVVARAEEELGQ